MSKNKKHHKTKEEIIREERLKQIVINAFKESVVEYNKKLNNPFYKLKLWFKKLIKS